MKLNAGIEGAVPEPLVKAEVIATYLDVTIKTLYDWRRARTGPPSYRVGKELRYKRSEVEAWVKAQQLSGGSA
jgi:excisionase family DNA binding protein